jgi:hypothetical protein
MAAAITFARRVPRSATYPLSPTPAVFLASMLYFDLVVVAYTSAVVSGQSWIGVVSPDGSVSEIPVTTGAHPSAHAGASVKQSRGLTVRARLRRMAGKS